MIAEVELRSISTMATVAEEIDRYNFFRSDRSDRMETSLK